MGFVKRKRPKELEFMTGWTSLKPMEVKCGCRVKFLAYPNAGDSDINVEIIHCPHHAGMPKPIRPVGHITDLIRELEKWATNRKRLQLSAAPLLTAIAYLAEFRDAINDHGPGVFGRIAADYGIRLGRIADLMRDVDDRILAGDGPAGDPGAFQREVTDSELKQIYKWANVAHLRPSFPSKREQ